MQYDSERPRLAAPPIQGDGPLQRTVAKVLGVVLGAALLVAVFMLSVVVFAVVAVVGVLAFAYLWWQTRELRRRMRERPPGGHVIEGESRREPSSIDG